MSDFFETLGWVVTILEDSKHRVNPERGGQAIYSTTEWKGGPSVAKFVSRDMNDPLIFLFSGL